MVELNVCAAVQVTDEAAVTKPGFVNVYVTMFGADVATVRPEAWKENVDVAMPLIVVRPTPEVEVTYLFPPASRSEPSTARLPVVVALPVIDRLANDGEEPVAMFCGRLRVRPFGELVVTVI